MNQISHTNLNNQNANLQNCKNTDLSWQFKEHQELQIESDPYYDDAEEFNERAPDEEDDYMSNIVQGDFNSDLNEVITGRNRNS